MVWIKSGRVIAYFRTSQGWIYLSVIIDLWAWLAIALTADDTTNMWCTADGIVVT